MTWFHVLLLDRAGNNLVNADFSPYSRMFFAVKHIYLTLYIVYMCRIAPIYSAPLYLLAALFTAFTCSLSLLFAPLACPRACVRSCSLCSPACVRSCSLCSPAPVPAYSRACLLPRLPAPVVRAYIVASPAVLLLAVLLSPPAANFFEIVFKPSISIPLSSVGVGGAVRCCYTG